MFPDVTKGCRRLQKATSGNLWQPQETLGNIKNILLIICSPVWHKLPPLGLAYVSEYFVWRGYNVNVIDLNIEKIFVMDNINKYNCIGFSVFKSNQHETLKLAKKIKEENLDIKIIFGGPQCFSWQFEKPPVEIQYADNIIVGDALPLFNEIPFPTFSLFKLDKYERKRALPILSSRGCVRKCRFCSERLLSKGYTVRNPEKIIEEIRYHKKVNSTKWFTFHDSLINGNLKQLEKLCDLLINENTCPVRGENPNGVLWDAQAIIRRDISEELLDKMKRSGCFNLFIGLESGSDKMLKLMEKGFTTRDAEIFFKKCKSVGLHFEVSLIVGFPGEGEDEFNETLTFIKRNREYIPKIAQINPFIKYSGTKVESVPINIGLKRVGKFKKHIEDLGIKYTPAFINNLVSEN